MGFKQWAVREFKSVVAATAYFGCCVGVLFVIKNLLLLEYHVATVEWATAVFGVLLLSKVVLVLEHVRVGAEVKLPAWAVVIFRTVLYTLGVAAALAVERGIKGWGEHGGFVAAIKASLQQRDADLVWANTLGICSAIVGYNALGVVRRNVGGAALVRMFLTPLPREHAGTSE